MIHQILSKSKLSAVSSQLFVIKSHMSHVKSQIFLVKLSRPRFWMYLAGPYLIGYVAGMESLNQLSSWHFILHFLYFLIPANVLLYGINDWFDEDTDKLNVKKHTHEHLLQRQQKRIVGLVIGATLILSVILLFFQTNTTSQYIFLFFIFLSVFYSTPPLRFKAKPFIDSFSNILYIMPGIFAYYQMTQTLPSWQIIIAGACWSASMHLFSAVPDIVVDRKAGITTTAVHLGFFKSLLLNNVLWFICAMFLSIATRSVLSVLATIYIFIPLYVIIRPHRINEVYWYFPYLNSVFGFILFWGIMFNRFL